MNFDYLDHTDVVRFSLSAVHATALHLVCERWKRENVASMQERNGITEWHDIVI